MKGTASDWMGLKWKVKKLRKTLQPIEDEIGLGKSLNTVEYDISNGKKQQKAHLSWWDGIEKISSKLLDTFNGNPDEDWWSGIITQKRYLKSASKKWSTQNL